MLVTVISVDHGSLPKFVITSNNVFCCTKQRMSKLDLNSQTDLTKAVLNNNILRVREVLLQNPEQVNHPELVNNV